MKVTNVKQWKTTLLGIISFLAGIYMYVSTEGGRDLSALFLVSVGVVLILSPDKVIDALIEKIRK